MLSDLLGLARPLEILDIGANPIDADRPYAPLLEAGLGRLTGFEPQADICAQLQRDAGSHERYLPYAIGDGSVRTFRQTHFSGLSSFLRPDPRALDTFETFRDNARVVAEIEMPTVRLDDLPEIEHVDFLKIDVQGAELAVLESAAIKLAGAVAIQTELSFVSLYEGQPGLGELDTCLRRMGFIPHCFIAIKNCIVSPLVLNNDARYALRQLLEADIVYVRDFIRPETLTDNQLRALAVVMDYCYQSVDLSLRCVYVLESRGAVAKGASEAYLEHLNRHVLPGFTTPPLPIDDSAGDG
ncbi:MAG: FkbM family methyltransferase [Gammaproteobacteria bacterium]|nr:FkbM family methyltransferase [Gammaproteobacteria bacterium]